MSNQDKQNSTTICTCDSDGVHFPCSICGKYHDDELDAILCCIEENAMSERIIGIL